jgi:hypothetical protein
MLSASEWLSQSKLIACAGPTGPSGPPGPTGLTGPTGNTGSSGATGLTGPSGPSGLPGTSGGTGPSGPSGASGFGADYLYLTGDSSFITFGSSPEAKYALVTASGISSGITYATDAGSGGSYVGTIASRGMYQIIAKSTVAIASTTTSTYVIASVAAGLNGSLINGVGSVGAVLPPNTAAGAAGAEYPLVSNNIYSLSAGDKIGVLVRIAPQAGDYSNISFYSTSLSIVKIA